MNAWTEKKKKNIQTKNLIIQFLFFFFGWASTMKWSHNENKSEFKLGCQVKKNEGEGIKLTFRSINWIQEWPLSRLWLSLWSSSSAVLFVFCYYIQAYLPESSWLWWSGSQMNIIDMKKLQQYNYCHQDEDCVHYKHVSIWNKCNHLTPIELRKRYATTKGIKQRAPSA